MPSDYERIRKENLEEYGRNSKGWRDRLLTELYDDRTHFLYELLQNAEDALERRNGRATRQQVRFTLTNDSVRFSHFGDPFTTRDVEGVCGIAFSTKADDPTAIGRFGMGFKSVYEVTERPEIHSGDEHFALDDYVLPVAVPPLELADGETVITLPRRSGGPSHEEIASAIPRPGARTLLFLREISEIAWSVEGGRSGLYSRTVDENEPEGVRRVTVRAEHDGGQPLEEQWFVFSRDVLNEGESSGRVEVAFRIGSDESDSDVITPIRDSRLVVFFPTAIETHLGMLIQGPYRTTQNRANVLWQDKWNRKLVAETALLLVDALRHLRDCRLLNALVFDALPLDRDRFSGENPFAPLFDALHAAVASERLLPAHPRGYVAASKARLTTSRGLRNLVSRSRLAELTGEEEPVGWLAGDITERQTPPLYRYLADEHAVDELDAWALLRLLKANPQFLEAQSDAWIRRLYGFLKPEELPRWLFNDVPLIRLEDGRHVAPGTGNRAAAFLPTDPPSAFSNTVKRDVVASRPAQAFLESLGLREPDLVDDASKDIRRLHTPTISYDEYEKYLQRLISVFDGVSGEQRARLTTRLRLTPFVRVVDAGTGERSSVRPRDAYLATRSIQALFSGVPTVLLVDEPLRREEVTRLLEASGVSRRLAIRESPPESRVYGQGWHRDEFWEPFGITSDERRGMRREAGEERVTRGSRQVLTDREFRGVEALLNHISALSASDGAARATLLWNALREAPREGFEGTYKWTYRGERAQSFASTSARLLNETAWVPDESGQLRQPAEVLFEPLGWTPDPSLASVITFREPEPPSSLTALADEEGVAPEILAELVDAARDGITAEDLRELRILRARRLRSAADPPRRDAGPIGGDRTAPVRPSEGTMTAGNGTEGSASSADATGKSGVLPTGKPAERGVSTAHGDAAEDSGARTFVSYIAVRTESEGMTDPDGLNHERRSALEDAAIELILKQEPELLRTPTNNPGFDLYEVDEREIPVRWVEVKAMSRDLLSRPATLSHTQFEHAREHGEAYWLYVVERAGSDEAHIVRIQNPAGRDSTYTFDHGWRVAAEADTATD